MLSYVGRRYLPFSTFTEVLLLSLFLADEALVLGSPPRKAFNPMSIDIDTSSVMALALNILDNIHYTCYCRLQF